MKTALKVVTWLLGTIVVLIVTAAIAVPIFLDPNSYKPRIAAAVQERTGRSVHIEGDIGVSVFPWLGVSVGAVELGNAPGFVGAAFARAQGMQVRVRLLPLLRGRVQMDTVRLRGLTLDLARDAEGRTNWDDLVGAPSGERRDGPPAIAALAIAGLDVSEATLSWRDAITGRRIEVSRLALQTGALLPGHPVQMVLSGHLDANDPALVGDIQAKGTVTADAGGTSLQASDLELGARLGGAAVPGGSAKIRLVGGARVDLERRIFTLSGLNLGLEGLALADGNASIAMRAEVTGDLAAQTLELDGVEFSGALTGGRFAVGTLEVAGAAEELVVQLAHGTLAATSARVLTVGLAVAGGSAGLDLYGDLSASYRTGQYTLHGLGFEGVVDGGALTAGPLAFAGEGTAATVDTAQGRVSATGARLHTSGLALAGGTADLSASGELSGDYPTGHYTLDAVQFHGALIGTGLGPSVGLRGKGKSLRIDLAAQAVAADALSAYVTGIEHPGASGKVSFTSDLSGKLEAGAYTFNGLKARGQLAGEGIGGQLAFELATDASADLHERTIRAQGLRIEGNLSGPRVPGGKLGFDLSADTLADLQRQRLGMTSLRAQVDGIRAGGEVEVAGLDSAISYQGRMTLQRSSPRKLFALLGVAPPRTADPDALATAEGSFGFSGSLNDIRLKPLALKVDSTQVKGSLAITDFARPAIRFDVDVDALDTNRYLPPKAAGQAASPGAAAGAAATLPVQTLRALDIDGKLRIGRLRIGGLKLSDVVLNTVAGGGLIRMSPLRAALYGGSYRGNVNLDARAGDVKLRVDEHLLGVDVGDLLEDLNSRAALSGRLDLDLEASAVGGNTDQLLSTLSGDLALSVEDATLRGIDVAATICQVLTGGSNLVGGEDVGRGLIGLAAGALGALSTTSVEPSKGRTRFDNLIGTARISDGLLVNRDLLGQSERLLLQGGGRAELLSTRLDYTARARLQQPCSGQRGVARSDLEQVPIGVIVGGTFANPKVTLDIQGLLSAYAGNRLRRKLTPRQPASPEPAAQEPARDADPRRQLLEGILRGILK